MQGNAFLFFGIFIFVFVLWVATGGPSRPISWAGPYIEPLSSGVTAQGSSINAVAYGSTGNTQTAAPARVSQASLRSVEQQLSTLERSVTAAVRFGTPSPYAGLVTLSRSTGTLGGDDPKKEYLTFSISSRATTTLDIRDWRIESIARARSLGFPNGVALPRLGETNQAGPIMVTGGDRVIVSMGEPPNGMSFKENECTGYFDQFQNFYPSLAHQCPLPIDDFDRFYYGNRLSLDSCRAYVKTIRRCETPTDVPYDSLAVDCYHFVDTYASYNGCVAAHALDANFSGHVWHVYLDREETFFTKDHDTVRLVDGDDRTIDQFSY